MFAEFGPPVRVRVTFGRLVLAWSLFMLILNPPTGGVGRSVEPGIITAPPPPDEPLPEHADPVGVMVTVSVAAPLTRLSSEVPLPQVMVAVPPLLIPVWLMVALVE